jgi:hypothetical protein
VAALLSFKAKRPVKVVMSRTEVFLGTGPTSGSYVKHKMGVTKDGRITAADALLCPSHFLADQALQRHGLWAGGWMTLARLLRCNPWGNSGLDFVPAVPPKDARWYLPWRYGRWRGTNSAP